MAFTDAQLSAINTRGKTILVSAAAGSGKTTTLTERIIRRLTDEKDPADIGRFLIVTFTKAAAADLKSKISSALGAELAKNPANRHLQRQMIKLGSADICTIDSFYLSVVKENFEILSLPARMSIMDESELAAIKLRIMSEVIEDFYEEKKEAFRPLMDCFMGSRGMHEAEEPFIKLHNTLSGYPDFLEFLQKNAQELKNEASMPFFSTRAGKCIADHCLKFLEYSEKIYADALDEINCDGKALTAYGPAFTYDNDHFGKTKEAILSGDYKETSRLFKVYSKLPLKSLRGCSDTLEEFKELRKSIYDKYEKLGNDFFSYSEETLSNDSIKMSELCMMLYELLSEFEKRFSEEKRSHKASDFTDNKRFALQLFLDGDGNPTELAKEYSKKYDEIYIDEYQDTDIVQDRIFDAISNGKNRFMVGDIKQSIYRFRGAKPSVFADYKNCFPLLDAAGINDSAAIYMSENFRCDNTVIRITNLICGFIFRKGPNSIGYIDSDDLVFGKAIKPDGRSMAKAELSVIRAYTKTALDKMADEEREKNEGNGGDLEVRYVVSEIARLLSAPEEKCEQGGEMRRLRPSDIAILTRGNAAANAFAKALSDVGIPCSARTTVNYFENPEVLLIMSLLNVIDNPQKDVYLAGVLRSPLFGFDMGDLIRIRKSASESGSLFDDLTFAAKAAEDASLREKIEFFLSKLELYRHMAKLLPIDKLLHYLYSDTLILSYVGGDGENDDMSVSERRANLLLLYDYARRYEAGSYKGLYSFIGYVNDIIESKQTIEPPATSGTSNVVNVMTIHNSKGLEFPVCFVSYVQKPMRNTQTKVNIEFDNDLGIGIKFGTESGFATIENAIHRSLILKNEVEEIEEEMRILYVAMTRARERLYLTGHVLSDTWESKASLRAKYADEYSIIKCSSYLDFIATAYSAMSDEDKEFLAVKKLQPKDIPLLEDIRYDKNVDRIEMKKEAEEKSSPFEIFKDRFKFEYEYSHLSRLPAKLSVSKLFPRVLDDTDDEIGNELPLLREKPAFLLPEAEKASGAERGTATHTFMQFCDFERAEKSGINEELALLCENGFISKESAALVNTYQLRNFFGSRFYKEFKKTMGCGGKMWREQRFNIEMPASLFTEDNAFKAKIEDEKVTVQGIIDLVFVDEDGNITLCDYKTDHLTKEELESPSLAAKMLRDRHGTQLSYYKEAVKQIFGKEPSRICIYSLPLGDAVDIDI